MNRKNQKRVLWWTMIVLSVSMFHGCAQIRKVTYPSDYVYLEKSKVDNTMALLGFYVRQINEILSRKERISDKDQIQVIELLSQINSKTDYLNAGNGNTNHLVFDDHIGDFKSDVFAAILAAKANPPNYYPAGAISGSCLACHKYRKF